MLSEVILAIYVTDSTLARIVLPKHSVYYEHMACGRFSMVRARTAANLALTNAIIIVLQPLAVSSRIS
jgi:hypothetical protein